ncbi:MAG: rod shape-determining protein MreC [Oscillatoria sp. SIO1A7]|nr:rod shape-determining protein MreC [Oscillatoria sp. SIO1A7]
MYTLRRWWGRHGLQLVLLGITISVALWIRYTQGSIVPEVYQWIARPFETQPKELTNAKIEELQLQLQELKAQNKQIKELLGYVKVNKLKPIVAPVVGRSADHWWEQLTLGRGSEDGIQKDFTVTAPGGLIGRVVSVTANSSRVLLVGDPSFKAGVIVSRSRDMGVMRGKGDREAQMEFFDKLPDVREGDAVMISSLSKMFPPGLPVGRVKSVNLKKSPAPEATIELAAPISSLEWVAVYPHYPVFSEQISTGYQEQPK